MQSRLGCKIRTDKDSKVTATRTGPAAQPTAASLTMTVTQTRCRSGRRSMFWAGRRPRAGPGPVATASR